MKTYMGGVEAVLAILEEYGGGCPPPHVTEQYENDVCEVFNNDCRDCLKCWILQLVPKYTDRGNTLI